jgi:ABC-type polysaccharide/polyol phosphate export permease
MNPLHHMVDVVRSPLLGKAPALMSYAVVMLITAAGWYLTYIVLRRFRSRIAYWS